MRKLLRANFYSLRKSRALWLCMAGAFVFSAFFMLRFSSGDETYTLDSLFMQAFPFLPILHAAFVSLFLGTEYQDGTLRNKLIVGHSRLKVYAASLVSSVVGCFAIVLAWALGSMVGVFRFGWFTLPAGTLLLAAVLILSADGRARRHPDDARHADPEPRRVRRRRHPADVHPDRGGQQLL